MILVGTNSIVSHLTALTPIPTLLSHKSIFLLTVVKLTHTPTGAGFVIFQQGTIIAEGARRLPPLTTVFQAEITAIQMAAQALPHLLLPTNRYAKNFTDSQASLLALNSSFITSQLIKNTILYLLSLIHI